MAIIHLFHGTSAQAYKDIKKYGFRNKENIIWNCSDIDNTYMYQLDKFVESEGMNPKDYSLEEMIDYCAKRANESAQIAQCFQSPNEKYTVVIEIIIDTEKTNIMKEIIPDDSCENMAECGAVQIPNYILDGAILNKEIDIKYHFFPFYPKMWVFYISGISSNQYIQEQIYKLEYMDREALRIINGIPYDDIYEDIVFVDEILYYHYQEHNIEL